MFALPTFMKRTLSSRQAPSGTVWHFATLQAAFSLQWQCDTMGHCVAWACRLVSNLEIICKQHEDFNMRT